MSIDLYNEIKQQNHLTMLPELKQSDLYVLSVKTDKSAITEKMSSEWGGGWVMYTDSIELVNSVDMNRDFLEAEFYNGDRTVRIRHLYGNEYLLAEYSQTSLGDGARKYESCAYYDQELMLRRNLRGKAKTAVYRLWQCRSDDGQWRPLVQQFMGFGKGA